MGIIYILWLRQIKRYWRTKSRIIGFMGQPLLFLLSFGFGFRRTFAQAGKGDYIQFLTPGIVAQAIIFVAVFSGVELIWDKQFGFLKETLVAPVSRVKIVLGRILGGATIATLQGLLAFLIALLFGFKPESWVNLVLAVLVMFLTSFLYTTLGTGIACLLKDFHGFQLIMTYLVTPSFFLSGALYPVDSAPLVLQILMKINPLSYGVDGLRQVLSGIENFGLGFDLLILSSISGLLLIVASRLFTKIEA